MWSTMLIHIEVEMFKSFFEKVSGHLFLRTLLIQIDSPLIEPSYKRLEAYFKRC